MGIDDAKTGGSHGLPWRLLGAVLVLKILVLSSLVPAPTVWWDESLLFSTAHDLAHLGSAEGPHANFLFYPPLTSAVTAPLHLLGLPGTWTYRLSLVVLSVFLWTAAVAMLLLYRELTQAFGGVADRERVPWPLAAILVSSSVFYLGFQLMSEPLFVAAYAWFLLSLFRFLVRREPRQAVLAGVAASLMVLGRGAGIGIPLVGLGVLVADAAMELWGRSKTGWRKLAPHLWILALPSITHTVWHRVDEHFQDPTNWALGAGDYLRYALEVLERNPQRAWALAHKIISNLAYVSLATLGVAVPLALWLAWYWLKHRRGENRARPGSGDGGVVSADPDERIVRARRAFGLLLLQVAGFASFAALAAALHMFRFEGPRPIAKYAVYGRYMEYFAPILWLLAWMAIERLVRGDPSAQPAAIRARDRSRVLLVAGAGLFAFACLWLMPHFLFGTRRVAGLVRIVPNHLGMGWTAALYELLPGIVALPWAAAGIAAFTVWALTRPSASKSGRRGPISPWALAALLVPMTANALVGPWQIVASSRYTDTKRAGLSHLISADSDPFGAGLYVDIDLRRVSPASLEVFLAYLDHLDFVRMGPEPEKHLGRMAVATYRRHHDVEVLHTFRSPMPARPGEARRPKRRHRRPATIYVYGPRRIRISREAPFFRDGFEYGDLDSWSESGYRPRKRRRPTAEETP